MYHKYLLAIIAFLLFLSLQAEYAELVESKNSFGIRDLQKKLKILQSNSEKILNNDATV
jgi:hypothetical protein